MAEPAPWCCPQCGTWIAPHVTEHRCDPPASGVTLTQVDPIWPAGGGWSTTGNLMPPGSTITVNVSGSAASQQDLVRAVQKGLARSAQVNPRRAG